MFHRTSRLALENRGGVAQGFLGEKEKRREKEEKKKKREKKRRKLSSARLTNSLLSINQSEILFKSVLYLAREVKKLQM